MLCGQIRLISCVVKPSSTAGETRLRQTRGSVGNEVFIAGSVSNFETIGRQAFRTANEFTRFACALSLCRAAQNLLERMLICVWHEWSTEQVLLPVFNRPKAHKCFLLYSEVVPLSFCECVTCATDTDFVSPLFLCEVAPKPMPEASTFTCVGQHESKRASFR